jgi:hypothetical protein
MSVSSLIDLIIPSESKCPTASSFNLKGEHKIVAQKVLLTKMWIGFSSAIKSDVF